MEGHAFISYVREDSVQVDRMHGALEARGIRVWRDTSDLWPGEDWRAKIRDAITNNALVFIACFSRNSVGRQKSYQREELTLAIEQMRRRNPDEPWLIPVRFDDCDIPDYDIGAGRLLGSIQRADLFGARSDEATYRLGTVVLRILGKYPRESSPSSRASAAQGSGEGIPGGEQPDTPRSRGEADLVQDPVGWVQAEIESRGVDSVLADLRSVEDDPANTTVAAVLAAVVGQAHNLRPPRLLNEPGYILRQLWMQSAELGEEALAGDIRRRLRAQPGIWLMPQWTTRRVSRALSKELGRHGGQGVIAGDQGVVVVAVLPDQRVVTAGRDGQILVWDPDQPQVGPTELGRHDTRVRAIAALPDGRAVTSGDDNRLLVWDPAQPQADPAELGRHSGARATGMWALGVLRDGRMVTGCTGNRVLVWDPGDPEAGPAELGRCNGWVMAIGVLPDGRVVTGGDHELLVWDPDHPEAGPAEIGRLDRKVQAIGVLADGRVVTSGEYGPLLVWDLARPGADPVELSQYGGNVQAIGALPDGRVVTGGGGDLEVLIWDPDHPEAGPAELGRHDRAVNAIAVLADGQVVAGDWGGQILIWDPPKPSVRTAQRNRHAGWVLGVAVLADGRVVTGDSDGRVLIRDPGGSGARAIELGRHSGRVDAVAVLRDGRVVTTGGGSLLVWDLARPGTSLSLGTYDQEIRAVAELEDGRVVTAGEDGRVSIWDPARPRAGRVELGQRTLPLWGVGVLADGRIVTSGPSLLVWDPARPGTDPAELGNHESIVGPIAVLSSGRVVAGRNDGRIMVWDPARPHVRVAELGRHDGPVQAIVELADGRIVTGGLSDGRLDVHEATRAFARVSELKCSVNALAAAPSGPARTNLVIAHQGNGISLWSVKERSS